MKRIAAFLSAIALAACTQTTQEAGQTNSVDVPTHQSEAAKPKSVPTKEERESIVTDSTKGMKHERDKMEKISFYMPVKSDFRNERLAVYVAVPDDRPPLIRIIVRYVGSDWIFFDQAKVMSDDAISYEKDFSRMSISRDNGSYTVYEYIDYAAQPVDVKALRTIASAKESTIRLSGRDRHRDFGLTKQELANLREVLAVYDAMEKLRPAP